jgi:hypothetical protein
MTATAERRLCLLCTQHVGLFSYSRQPVNSRGKADELVHKARETTPQVAAVCTASTVSGTQSGSIDVKSDWRQSQLIYSVAGNGSTHVSDTAAALSSCRGDIDG